MRARIGGVVVVPTVKSYLSRLLRLHLVVMLCLLASCASVKVPTSNGIFIIVQTPGEQHFMGTGWLAPGQCSSLITAAHVVENGGPIVVITKDGPPLPASIVKIGTDILDVALITLNPVGEGAAFPDLCRDGVSPFAWGKEPKAGDTLWYGGYPGPLGKFLTGPATLLTDDRTVLSEVQAGEYLALSAPSLIPGQSGAPLFDAEGKVVGLMKGAMGAKNSGTIEYAVPVDVIRKFLKR